MTRDEAAKTAAESLAGIERWARMTFLAAVAGLALLLLMAGAAGYMMVDYLRFKAAAADTMKQLGDTWTAPTATRVSVPKGGVPY